MTLPFLNTVEAKSDKTVSEDTKASFWELPSSLPDAEERLLQLEKAIYNDLEIVCYPGRTWDYSRSSEVLEVAILGAGHSGKSAAFGLRQQGITNVTIFDRRPAGLEGVWREHLREMQSCDRPKKSQEASTGAFLISIFVAGVLPATVATIGKA